MTNHPDPWAHIKHLIAQAQQAQQASETRPHRPDAPTPDPTLPDIDAPTALRLTKQLLNCSQTVNIEVDAMTAWFLLSALQLTLRHPDVSADPSLMLYRSIENLAQLLAGWINLNVGDLAGRIAYRGFDR